MPHSRTDRPSRRAVRSALQASVAAATLAIAGPANALVTFTFDFSANTPGVGFLDPTLGAARQASLNDAAAQFSTLFGQHFANSGSIVLRATSSDQPTSSTLASAGSEMVGGGGAGFTIKEVVRTKLLGGADANGAAPDGNVDVNFGIAWQLDAGTPVGAAQFDFHSTLIHEFTHAIGFTSTIDQNGASLFGDNSWNTFDGHLRNHVGTPLIGPSFALDAALWSAVHVGGASGPGQTNGGLFFGGANAVAVNGGPVGLFSPSPYQPGSSNSHLDDANTLFAGRMMLSATGTGASARVYSPLEVAILTDLGYTPVAAIPEPATVALLLAGLTVVGGAARRRRPA